MKSRKLAPALVTAVFLLSISAQNVFATEIVIVDNGSGSDNTVVFQQETNQQVQQNNDADVNNNVQIDANTGGNTASNNTGDSTIQTGDITTDTNIQNQANSSSVTTGCCETEATNVNVSGNGSNSTNAVTATNSNNTSVNVDQSANINNNVTIKADTGSNETSYNNGDTSIKTGNITVGGEVKNGPINSNNVDLSSGNTAAKINVSGNGSNSQNYVLLNQYNNQHVNVNNNANIFNNVYFDLNTGKNKSSLNNGDTKIITGNILVDFFLNNGPINTSDVDIDCCGKANEQDRPDEDPTDGEDKNDDKENDNGDNRDGEEKEGQLLSEAASTERGGDDLATILGLSDTSSGSGFDPLFWMGLFGLAFGLKLIGESLTSRSAVVVVEKN